MTYVLLLLASAAALQAYANALREHRLSAQNRREMLAAANITDIKSRRHG
jgi:hypothetical protein